MSLQSATVSMHDETHLPRRRTAGLILQDAGTELMIYDERAHKALCLNHVAATVWKCCDGTSNVDQIAARVSTEVGARVDREVVLLAFEELERDGLLESTRVAAMVSGISRRELVSRLGAGALLMMPAMAAIMAPKAAQAYNGCVDCTSPSSRAAANRNRSQSGSED